MQAVISLIIWLQNFALNEVQPLRNDVCLILFYGEVQLTVPVTTNIERELWEQFTFRSEN